MRTITIRTRKDQYHYGPLCDGKIIKIPRQEFIFRTCEDRAAWHLIPRRISSSKDSLFGCRETGRLCWG